MKLVMFSKNLDMLPLVEACEVMQAAALDGVDLAVRPASGNLPPGRVLPEEVRHRLPEVISCIASHSLDVPMLTTAIRDADDAFARDTFEVASDCGVAMVKVNLWPYRGFGTFAEEMDLVQHRLDGLEKLAARTRVRAIIHVHSGSYMSASPFIVWHWIKDRDPACIGAYVDFEHMSTETTPTSRVMALDLLATRVSAVAVKDFRWRLVADSATHGQAPEALSIVRVPVGEGVVPWAAMFDCLSAAGADPLISMHSEYRIPSSWRVLNTTELIEQTHKDVQFIRSQLRQTQAYPSGVARLDA